MSLKTRLARLEQQQARHAPYRPSPAPDLPQLSEDAYERFLSGEEVEGLTGLDRGAWAAFIADIEEAGPAAYQGNLP